MRVRIWILNDIAREWLTHDLGPFREVAAHLLYWFGRALIQVPSAPIRANGFRFLMRLHRAALSPTVDRHISREIRRAIERERRGSRTGLWFLFDSIVESTVRVYLSKAGPDPTKQLGKRILVVKSPANGERGVVIVDYEFALPLMFGAFHIEAICESYDLVLEPSWAGVCAPEILMYTRLDWAVTVQTMEPRDHQFITALHANLDFVAMAANWWADSDQELTVDRPREFDVAMVASWSRIKRHWRFFRVLAKLRASGHKLRVALVGYAGDLKISDIEELANHFGVRDQIELFERLPQTAVQDILCRSKIHVLWSRREASGRAIIEALLADTPVIVREGLTFGFGYAYINSETGAFVSEQNLGEAMLQMIDERSHYSPRAWALDNIGSEKATELLETHLRERALQRGESWTKGIVPKVSALDTQYYLNEDDRKQFAEDYALLASYARHEVTELR